MFIALPSQSDIALRGKIIVQQEPAADGRDLHVGADFQPFEGNPVAQQLADLPVQAGVDDGFKLLHRAAAEDNPVQVQQNDIFPSK